MTRRRLPSRTVPSFAPLVVLMSGCMGSIGGMEGPDHGPGTGTAPLPPTESGGGGMGAVMPDPATPLDEFATIGPMMPRQLTQHEYGNTIEYLFGAKLPDSDLTRFPVGGGLFEADDGGQAASAAPLAEGTQFIAEGLSVRLRTDPDRRNRIVGCMPGEAGDAVCMERFVKQFGRRVLRRPLRPEETKFFVDRALTEAAVASDFYKGVELVMRVLLQDIEFLYRIETGTEVAPGIVRLTPHEVATRLSFLLWGRPPQDAGTVALATLADQGNLSERELVSSTARTMLATDWAKAQIRRFHAVWMQFEHAEQVQKAESDALVERILFTETDTRSWLDLFRMKETCLTRNRATAYGLPWPSGAKSCGPGAAWVPYDAGGRQDRQGILSHASILNASLQGHEYPVNSELFRGKYLQETLLCNDIHPAPSGLDLKTRAPATGECKKTFARGTRQQDGTLCQGCHRQMDELGFGLENYDEDGLFHATEESGCDIPGEGEVFVLGAPGLVSLGTFKGPGGLGQLLVDKRSIDQCAVKQLFRFAVGRRETAKQDPALLDLLTDAFRRTNHSFEQLLLGYIGSEAFRHRRLDMTAPAPAPAMTGGSR